MSLEPDLVALVKRLKLGQVLPTLPERLTLARAQQLDSAAFLTLILILADEVQRRDRQEEPPSGRRKGPVAIARPDIIRKFIP